ncbi:MAG: hypothetical protein ACREAC_17125, partial [Blastocatellia bacterium]
MLRFKMSSVLCAGAVALLLISARPANCQVRIADFKFKAPPITSQTHNTSVRRPAYARGRRLQPRPLPPELARVIAET